MKLNYALLLILALFLAGCSGSPKTTYYTLGSASESAHSQAAVSRRTPSLGVGPVKLPALLDRQGMVLRKDNFTLDVSDQHLWGGQLEEEFLDALTERLQARLPQTRLQNVPWELEQTPRLQFILTLSQFDGIPAGVAVMKGSWVLQKPDSGKLVRTGRINLQVPVAGAEVDAVVRAQSRLVSELADQLVAALP